MSVPKCEDCSLSPDMYVPPSGNFKEPLILFVGEAPGQTEVRLQYPFAGEAGGILRGVLQRLGIPEHECMFANMCACRPPANRTPKASEVSACRPFLEEMVQRAKPLRIVALGAVAGTALFPEVKGITKHRGRMGDSIFGIPGIATFHPAATLYAKGDTKLPYIVTDIAKVWRDLRGIELKYENVDLDYSVVYSADEYQEVLRAEVRKGLKYICYDWETTGLDPRSAVGFCLGLSFRPGHALVIPMDVVREVLPELRKLFNLEGIPVVAFNAMFDSQFNKRIGLRHTFTDDPMLMHYVIDERPQPRSLENLSIDYCGAEPYETAMLAKYRTKKDEMLAKVPEEDVYLYNAKDADYAGRLYSIFAPQVTAYPFYKPLLINAAHALIEMQERGVLVDKKRLRKAAIQIETNLRNLLAKLREDYPELNPRSPAQIAAVLWDDLALPEPDLYKRKPRSVDKATLAALTETHPSPFLTTLMEYRYNQTIASRYTRPLFKHTAGDGRLRAQYHLDRTETGRLSTTKPAIHQIPRDTELRGIFRAAPDHVLIQADYAQIEIRMAAHCAQDHRLADLCTAEDFHTKMASAAFRVPYPEVTSAQRQAAKSVSFGLLYLMGDRKLAESTGLPLDQALEFVHAYKKMMPGVWRWIETKIKPAVSRVRYVESIFGRRRRFHLVTASNLAALQREAVNMPIQSGASDLTLSSLLALRQVFKEKYPEVHIVIMVHDSLVVECPKPLAAEVAKIMHDIMTVPPFKTFVSFPVDIKIGTHWGEGREVTP